MSTKSGSHRDVDREQRAGPSTGLGRRVAVVLAVAGITFGSTATSSVLAAEDARVKRVQVQAAGVALRYPADWLRFDLSKRDIRSIRDATRSENPELVDDVDPGLGAKATKFYAEDPKDGDNVSLFVLPGLFPSGKSAFEDEIVGLMSPVPGFELVSTETAKVGRRKAMRADYRYEITADGTVLPIYEVWLGFPKPGSNDRVVSVVVTVDDTPLDISVADEIARSIRSL